MIFGARKIDKFRFKIDNENIEVVKSYKYLGTLFSSNGSFKLARQHISNQANKAMHLLLVRISNLDIPIDLQLKLFDSTILPILTYGSEIWGFENIDMIEKVHNDFLRKITNSRRSTPMYILYSELGRTPLNIIIRSKMIKFWSKILDPNSLKLVSSCYHYMLHT